MATIQVTAPNGRTIRIQAPEGATEDEIRRYVGEIARTQPELGLPIPGMPDMPEQAPEAESPGLMGAAGNAVVRMGGRAVGLTDAYQAEQLSRAADAQEEMARREAAGEMTWLDRIATWRPSWAAPLETPEELRGLAADRVVSQAQRDQRLAEQYPMSERGRRGVEALSGAESFSEGLGVVASQPLDVLAGALEVGVEQAPTLAAAAAATVATRNPGVGMGIMGASTYAQERFGQMAVEAQKFGYDLTKPADARRAIADEEFMAAQQARGETRGSVIALVDALTFKAGASLFNPRTARGLAANAALQVGGGATGEALAQLATDGQISAPGEVILEGLAEGPFSAVELAMSRAGRGADEPSPTGSDLDAELAAEEAALAASARQEEQAKAEAEDREVRETRLEYAPTFVSETDFVAQRQAALRADAENADTETGQAFREYLINEDILPTNEQERTTALNAFVKSTLAAQDRNATRLEYRTALDDHIGRMRDLENVLTKDPEAGTQLEMDLGDAQPDAASAPEPAATEDGQLEMDLQQQEDTAAQLDPARMAAEIVKAAGVQITDNVVADISARMEQIKALPVAERPAEARALVASYTTPQKKAPKSKAVQQAQAPQQEVARVPDPITMETPVRRRQDGQAKADALLPANWTEDARYDNVNSALNGKNFSIKKFNDALQAAVNPQEETQAVAEPEADTEVAPQQQASAASFSDEVFRKGLKPQEKQVYETLSKSAADGTLGDIVSVAWNDGVDAASGEVNADERGWKITFDNAKLARRSGIKNPKSGKTAAGNVATALRDYYGEDRLREMLAVSGVGEGGGLQIADSNTATDLVSQGGAGMSTVATAGGSQSEGASSRASAAARAKETKAMKRAGMTPEQIKAFYDGSPANVAAAAENDQTQVLLDQAQQDEDFAVKQADRMLRAKWAESNPTDIAYDDLSDADKRMWMKAVYENIGLPTADALESLQQTAQGIADSVSPDEEVATDEGQQEQGDQGGRAEVRAADGNQGNTNVPQDDGGGRAADGGPTDSGGQNGPETRAARAERQQVRDVAQQISDADPTPKELRNQRSFKESYAAKEGASSGLWENPNLKEAAQLADWLGGLSQQQWDAINPAFTNDLNPFKNPASIDFQEAKAKLEAVMSQSAPDTGVIGEAKPAPKVEVRKKRKVVKPPKFSLGDAEANAEPTAASVVKDAVKWLIGTDANWRVSTLKNPDDLIGLVLSGDLNVGSETLAEVLAKPNPRGVVITDNDGVARAFFFTDNIAPGAERGVVMHEIGSHIGMDNVLTSEQKATAVGKIRGWAEAGDKSLENLIALRAKERLGTAQRADAAKDADSELLAYFLEEAVNAGVTPNSDSKSDLVSFVRQLWADFKRALRKLRPANEPALTAQDLVNMAKGAARLELATDFHGATSAFRSVNADYFGLGNNAVGVGFYVTEDQEVGVNYMEMRMEERQSDDADNLEGYLQRIDTAIAENEFMDWDAPLSEQPNVVEVFNQLPEEIQSGVLKQNRAQAIEDINGRQLYLGLTGVQLQTQALQDYIGDAELARANRHSRGTTRAMAIVSAFLDTVGIKGLKTEVTGDVRGVQAGPNPVFNKIIFSADNAVVVGRTSYGDIDYDANGAPQLRPGTVKFSVGDPVGGPQVDWVARNMGNGAAEHASNLIEVAKAPVTATKNLRRVIRDVEKKMPSARKWYGAMLASEKTRNSVLGMVESVVNQARTIKKERKALVNDFLATSTFYQKWGYDPQWTDASGAKVAVTIDPIMKAKYDRLTAEEQQLVRDVFEHGRKIQQMMQKVAKDLGVSQFFRLDGKLTGPYAPLKRFGDHVGQLKSQDLLDAEAALERDKTPKARELVEKLKSDPKHYVVSFFANKGTAETFVRENQGSFAYAVASEKAVDFDTARPGGAQVYEKILGAINANAAGLDQSAKDAMAKMVRDMYFQTLDDSNARLSGLRRLNRAGFEKDMLRSFAAHGSAQANLIAQLQHGADIAGALVEAKREADRDASRLMPVYNQLATKFRAVMTPRTGALARLEDGVMKFNSFYMLTSSMGYFFQNQTQPVYAVAQIAGDLGYTKQPAVFGKLLSGYGVARKVVNTGWLRQAANVASMGLLGKNAAVELDLQQAPPEIRPVLQAMQDRGVLDVGVAEDLSRFSISSEGNLVSRGYREMTHRLYQSARYVESMNRIASAVAAFKMAQQNPAKMRKLGMTPLEYALSVVEDTQGNFSQLDAPALFDAVPLKAPLQFRKFQFQMAWLHIDAMNQAFRGADLGTKVAGFRKASLLMGYTGILGGLVSVPMSSAVSAIVQAVLSGLSGDDEENPPRSLERWIRENVEDERTATLLARGVPAALGWDFSQKLDQSDIFMPFSTKYVELNPDRDGYLLALAQIGLGATGTMVGNLGNVHDFVNRGDLYRAAEYALPKGLRAYMETLRFAERGMETRAGLELQSPTDFSVFDMLTNAVGLPSTEINQIRWTRGQQIEIEQWFTARSGAIRRDYLEAYDARDRAGMAEARDAFRELNAARDRVRPFFGDSRQVLRRQPLSNLLRAPRDRRREQRRLDSIMGR